MLFLLKLIISRQLKKYFMEVSIACSQKIQIFKNQIY